MCVCTCVHLNGVQTHGVYFVEGLPLFILDPQSLCSLDGPLHVTGPHLQITDVLALHVVAKCTGKLGGGVLSDHRTYDTRAGQNHRRHVLNAGWIEKPLP